MKIIDSHHETSMAHGYINFLDKNNQPHKVILVHHPGYVRLYYFNVQKNSRYIHDYLTYPTDKGKTSEDIIKELKLIIKEIDFYEEIKPLLSMEELL